MRFLIIKVSQVEIPDACLHSSRYGHLARRRHEQGAGESGLRMLGVIARAQSAEQSAFINKNTAAGMDIRRATDMSKGRGRAD